MALVAYDYSDESENENDETSEIIHEPQIIEEKPGKLNGNETLNNPKLQLSDDEEDNINSFNSINYDSLPFSNQNKEWEEKPGFQSKNIPPPKNHNINRAELRCKAYTPKYISILSKQSKSSEDPIVKKAKSSNPEGGLSSLLPAPQYERPDPEIKVTKVTSLLPSTFLKSKPMGVKKSENENDDDDDDNVTDFFSLNKSEKEEYVEPIEIELPSIKPPTELPDPDLDIDDGADYTVQKKPEHFNITYEDTSSFDGGLNLDNEAMHLFFGRKRKTENPKDLEIIEVKEEEILAESKQALMKQLTEETSYAPPNKKGCSSLSKKKHQITYLAFQAKERELELKNMWAQNRLTKKQTQMKYGF